jgi:serine/threonine protein kinase
MDYCGVGSVKDMMKACVETLDEEQISAVTCQVLKGLAYLHAKGIVHMDVKCANILITEDGQIKLGNIIYCAQMLYT